MTFPTYSVSGLICNYYKGVFTHEKLNTAYLSIVAWTMEAQVGIEPTIKVLQTSSLASWILCHNYTRFRTPVYYPTIMLTHCDFLLKSVSQNNCYNRLCKIRYFELSSLAFFCLVPLFVPQGSGGRGWNCTNTLTY